MLAFSRAVSLASRKRWSPPGGKPRTWLIRWSASSQALSVPWPKKTPPRLNSETAQRSKSLRLLRSCKFSLLVSMGLPKKGAIVQGDAKIRFTFSKPCLRVALLFNVWARKTMEESFAKIITSVGEDLTRPGLVDTPLRAAKAFEFLTKGYHQNLEDVINNALFPSESSEMVIVKDIELYSMCEHHLLPFVGKCHVAYIPNGKVLGLSKVARIVDMYARRLQIQENLVMQVANTIESVTG